MMKSKKKKKGEKNNQSVKNTKENRKNWENEHHHYRHHRHYGHHEHHHHYHHKDVVRSHDVSAGYMNKNIFLKMKTHLPKTTQQPPDRQRRGAHEMMTSIPDVMT